MGIALRVPVSVKKGGKGPTATKWIKTPFNVYRIVPVMGLLIWTRKLVHVNLDGRVKIVQEVTKIIFCDYYETNKILELCDLDCGNNGHCVSDSCQCDPGWSGEFCNLKQCDPRCNDHGQCKNGTCLCVTGWNGKHCTMEGCPNSCSSHGQCRFSTDSMWECRCDNGWDGSDCSILLEQNCNDGRDNDKGWNWFFCNNKRY